MEHPSSFYVECEALKSIRHRNLVRVIGLCSTFDTSGFEFKALFFAGMNSKHLFLSLDQMATLKSGSIQNDFGLAKFLQNNIISLGDASSTTRLRGSIGYIAPEYGLGCKISIEDDVYSYGIIVPEIIIGKRPNFTALAPTLTYHHEGEDPNHAVVEMQTSIELAKLGLKCTEPSPKDRSTMCDVYAEIIFTSKRNIMQSSTGEEDDTIVDNELKMNQIATMRIPALQ
uniref:Protein kinase domain-containing protein n=1 Tax=Oryza nivara TaxID=4536 RepID=A0A0E0IP60_ORYNI